MFIYLSIYLPIYLYLPLSLYIYIYIYTIVYANSNTTNHTVIGSSFLGELAPVALFGALALFDAARLGLLPARVTPCRDAQRKGKCS